MPDNKEKEDDKAFNAAVNETSLKLIEESLKLANGDALQSVVSIVMAAGRAAAMSGLPLGIQLNLFASQYDMMVESIRKREAAKTEEGPVETPQEIPSSLNRKRTIN